MTFFVVERSVPDGVLRVPLSGTYETREAALAALSAAVSTGQLVLAGEVFIADLSAAIPVLVMQPAAQPVEAEAEAEPELEPQPEVEPELEPEPQAEWAPEFVPVSTESAAEPVQEEEPAVEPEAEEPLEAAAIEEAAEEIPTAEEVFASWEGVSEVSTEEAPSLADALKRAATSLEDEGIVAPESVESSPVEPLEEPVAQAPVDEVAPSTSWPWAEVASYEIPKEGEEAPAPLTDVVPVAEFAAVSVEETVSAPVAEAEPDLDARLSALVATPIEGDEAPMIPSAPAEGEEAYMPKPVILGDYVSAPAEPMGVASEPAGEVAVEAFPASDAIEEPVAPQTASDEAAETVAMEAPPAEAVTVEAPAYEPEGDLDLSGYTCDDCVYANTCPKAGETTPTECLSFQWRAE